MVQTESGAAAGDPHEDHQPQSKYLVNTDRHGQVAPHGEDLEGKEILRRVGLDYQRYELFPLHGNEPGPEILPDQRVFVKPGDRFRATIRNADYSDGRGMR